MNVSASPYTLVARADGRRRLGSLLKVQFDDGILGYADLHPWPEFDDAPLAEQLLRLALESPPNLAARSLEFARADAEARAQGRSLFDALTVPPSHASLPYGHTPAELRSATSQGYEKVKLKGWDFSKKERQSFAESGLRFRLDFNARLGFSEVEALLHSWGDLGWIDWIEDPCPYDDKQWGTLQKRFGIELALDLARTGHETAFDVLVLKPARAKPTATPEGRRVAVTSYLDHPVGQLFAAWTAACIATTETCGLVTHEVYEETEFSRQLAVDRTRLVPPGGPGIGFAQELEALPWSPLKL